MSDTLLPSAALYQLTNASVANLTLSSHREYIFAVPALNLDEAHMLKRGKQLSGDVR